MGSLCSVSLYVFVWYRLCYASSDCPFIFMIVLFMKGDELWLRRAFILPLVCYVYLFL